MSRVRVGFGSSFLIKPLFVGEHLAIKRGHAKKNRWPELFQVLENYLRGRPMRVEHAGGSDRHGEIHTVPKPIGEEEPGCGKTDIIFGQFQYVLPVCLGSDYHV